jgi:DNA-binding transcriptional LysR family regulator
MWFKHQFAKVPSDLRVVYSAESVIAVLNAIAGEIGIGVVPSSFLNGEFAHLKMLETGRARFVNRIAAARPLGKKSSPRETAFLDFFLTKSY